MRRGFLFELLLVILLLFLLIIFYFHYLGPRIGRIGKIEKEAMKGMNWEKRDERRREVDRREEIPETTGIQEVDEYQRRLQDAKRQLKRLQGIIRR